MHFDDELEFDLIFFHLFDAIVMVLEKFPPVKRGPYSNFEIVRRKKKLNRNPIFGIEKVFFLIFVLMVFFRMFVSY